MYFSINAPIISFIFSILVHCITLLWMYSDQEVKGKTVVLCAYLALALRCVIGNTRNMEPT